MQELTAQQVAVLEGLRERGFQLAAFPLYANHVGVKRGNCAALLAPVGPAGMMLYGEVCYLVDGNLSVRVQRGGQEWFVWKKRKLEATAERRKELEGFREELEKLLADAR